MNRQLEYLFSFFVYATVYREGSTMKSYFPCRFFFFVMQKLNIYWGDPSLTCVLACCGMCRDWMSIVAV